MAISSFFSVKSQQQYLYADQLIVSLNSSQVDSLKKTLKDKGAPDHLIDGIAEKILEQNSNKEQKRLITVKNDSTFIELQYGSSYGNQSLFLMPTNQLLFFKGHLFRQDPASKEYILSKISDSSLTYNPTQKTRIILGYSCREYKSLDGHFTIWLNKELPATINPGIATRNVSGAILGFEVKKGGAITKSEIIQIGKGQRTD